MGAVAAGDHAAEADDQAAALALLSPYQIESQPIFVIGTFDKGVTVLSQQMRALNLAWALVASRTTWPPEAGHTAGLARS